MAESSGAGARVLAEAHPEGIGPPVPVRWRGLRQTLRAFARRRLALCGAALVLLAILLALLAPMLAPYPPNAQNASEVTPAAV